MRPTSRGVNTAESGGSIQISGEGSVGKFNDVLISENIRTSVISVSKLADQGIYSLFTVDSVRLLSADTGKEIASGHVIVLACIVFLWRLYFLARL